MTTTASPKEIYHCLVLSGGGAKGAYGAGVAKALEKYRAMKRIENPLIYIGSSAGALNAYLLASKGADEAIRFWREASNASVLNVWLRSPLLQGLGRFLMGQFSSKRPFSIYPNTGLEKLINEHVHLADVKSPLVIAATDYSKGMLKAFYVSDMIDALVREDAKASEEAKRLSHLRKITSDELLRKALLASAAIPVFFPPVSVEIEHAGAIEKSWYVDGGVGNHTPTREAAYILRYYFAHVLKDLELIESSTVYCVSQDKPRIVQNDQRLRFFDVVMRTQEVYHHIHTQPIVKAWDRINSEVATQNERVKAFERFLETQDLDEDTRKSLAERVRQQFLRLGGADAPRVNTELIQFEPHSDLGDPLNFNRKAAEAAINLGYSETLGVLRNRSKINAAELTSLLGQPAF